MKYVYAFALLFLTVNTFSQTRRELRKQQEKLVTRAVDSIYLRDDYKQIQDKLHAIALTDNNYTSASVLTLGVANTNTNAFNNGMTGTGFANLNPNSVRLGLFGFSHKHKHLVVDFLLFNFNFGNTIKRGDDKIEYRVTDLLSTNVGYSIIDSRKFTLYPFAGAAVRTAQLNYSTAATVNSGSTNIVNLVQNNRSANLTNLGVVYQAGLAGDLLLREARPKRNGVLLHLSAMHTGHLGKNVFRSERNDIRFQPNLDYGNFIFTAGLKMFMRK
jgi:hypothetical protein